MVDNSMSTTPEALDLEARFGSQGTQESVTATAPEQTSERKEGARESEQTYNKILSHVQNTTTQSVATDQAAVMMDDMSTLDQARDRESQIKHLIQLAMDKDVEYAVKVAQKAEDYYVLDQLHDRLLADDLHDALASRGLIKDLTS